MTVSKNGKTALISRNIKVNNKRTSIRLESQMWIALKELADREKCSIHDVCSIIANKKSSNITLTAAIRIFIMLYYKAAATEDGHKKAGHGNFCMMIERITEKNMPSYDTENVHRVKPQKKSCG